VLTLYTTPVVYLFLDGLRLRFLKKHPPSPKMTAVPVPSTL
jgi:hypothetical protein